MNEEIQDGAKMCTVVVRGRDNKVSRNCNKAEQRSNSSSIVQEAARRKEKGG